MREDNLFALDFVPKFVQRMYDMVEMRVPLLAAHGLVFGGDKRAFGNEDFRVENGAVLEQALAEAVSHETHLRFEYLARNLDTCLPKCDDFACVLPEELVLEFSLVQVERAAHRRDGVFHLKGFQDHVLPVA